MISSVFLSPLRWLVLGIALHPIHVSVTEIEFDEKSKALEIMMRVFTDDLELSLRNRFDQPDLDIFDPRNARKVDEFMGQYLSERFAISLDGKSMKANYLGHEQETDVHIFYIEVENVRKWQTIEVKNSIITEVYDDQSNLVHVIVGEEIKSLRLTRDKPAGKLTFPK